MCLASFRKGRRAKDVIRARKAVSCLRNDHDAEFYDPPPQPFYCSSSLLFFLLGGRVNFIRY